MKSCETKKAPERPTRVRDPLLIPITDDKCCSNLNDVNRRISNLKILPWTYRTCDNITYLELKITPYLIPKYIIKIDESLDFNLLVYNWPLPDDQFIYKMHRRSFRNVFISLMLKNINDLVVCAGVKHPLESSKVHIVPIEVNEDDLCPVTSMEMHRSPSCDLLTTPSSPLCNKCIKMEKDILIKTKRITKNANTAAKPNAPLSFISLQRLSLALKEKRDECTEQKAIILRLQKEIENKCVEINSNLGHSVIETMTKNEEKLTPFMKLFWAEQKKYRSQSSIRYHPMIIRFALSLAIKSGSTYDELRKSGIMVLPTRRTLRRYKNAIRPETGFNPEIWRVNQEV